MKVLETERLYLRRMTPEDAINLYLLNLDTTVIKFTGDQSFDSIESAKLFLENYDHYKKYGFGRWAVISKSNNEFLGWCGLKFRQEENVVDIGFRLKRKYWSNGYATEAAFKCLEIGFTKYNLPIIVGRAMKENVSSIRVLEKIGLSFLKPFNFDGNEGVVYFKKNPLHSDLL